MEEKRRRRGEQRERIKCADGGTVVVKLCENSVMCLTRQVSLLFLSFSASSLQACLFHFLFYLVSFRAPYLPLTAPSSLPHICLSLLFHPTKSRVTAVETPPFPYGEECVEVQYGFVRVVRFEYSYDVASYCIKRTLWLVRTFEQFF